MLWMYFPDESYLSNENREQKKLRAYYKASRQAELKRYLRQRIFFLFIFFKDLLSWMKTERELI